MLADPMQSLSGLRLLVTGGSGFRDAAVSSGCRAWGVGAVSRHPRTSSDGVRWEAAELTEDGAVQGLLRGLRPDVVLHLASEVSGARDRDLVLPMLRANLLAAIDLMLACADAACRRLVLAGSMEEPELGDPAAVGPSARSFSLAWTRSQWSVASLERVAVAATAQLPPVTALLERRCASAQPRSRSPNGIPWTT